MSELPEAIRAPVPTTNIPLSLPVSRRTRRRMFRRLPEGSFPGYAPICLDSNDPDTVRAALYKRLACDLPPCNELQEITDYVQNFLRQRIAKVRRFEFEEWLESTPYSENRKSQLRAAHDVLRGGHPTKKQCSHVDMFIKTEGYVEYKNARNICSRSDFFKVFSGPYFKAIENEVYKLEEFIKHTPVPERPAKVRALRKAGVRYYQTDYSSFESHFTPEVMNAIECALYRHCLEDYPEDAELICQTLTGMNRMRTRTGVHATLKGRRMSGDMCTSLGNGFTNLILTSYLCSKQGKELRGFVEGDDGLFATEAILTESMYENLGFRIKIGEVADPTRASFCGMVFAESGEIIKDPLRFMGSFGWTSSFINAGPVIMNGLLRAKALSAVCETPQCPILGAMARRCLDSTRAYAPRWVDDGYHPYPRDAMAVPPFCPSSDTRQLFADLYHVSVDAQLEVERRILEGDWDVADVLPPPADQLHYSSRYIERG